MNGETFYDSFQDWHPPSPRSTPQSSKFGFFPFQSPIAAGTSPLEAHHAWMTSQPPSSTTIGGNQPYTGQDTVVRSSNSTSSKRQRPPSSSYSPIAPESQHHSAPAPQPSYPQAGFPGGSFVERFDSTTLDDPYTGPPAMVASTPVPQMHTPPPTRDDSGRRKPQQPRLVEFQTPSTIVSRRMSAPNDAWQHHTSDVPFANPSPYVFTPLQFSPPPSHFGFTPSGPMTAPAYPQSNLFWEPNSNQALNQMSFSTVAEDSFGMNPESLTAESFTFEPPQSSNHRFSTSEGFRAPTQTSQALPRPQSARPADFKHGGSLSKSSFLSTTSSVDPTVLWNTQNADTSSFPQPSSVAQPAGSEPRQPYQHQAESLRREKEEKSRRGLKGTSGSHAHELASNTAERSLRRSLTDSRARRSANNSQISSQASSSDAAEAVYSSNNPNIPRESSPLKRHKVGSQNDRLTPTKPRSRRSVVLTVDEKGRARTEIKAVADDPTSRSLFRAARSLDGDSDSSDLPETAQRIPNIQPSRRGNVPASSDAQEALREVVRNRKMNRPDFSQAVGHQDSSTFGGSLPSTSLTSSASKSHQNAGSSHSNNSPTTITDPEFQTPSRDGNFESSGNTRCHCNGRVPEDRANLMIECESCKNWLHVACLGISPEQIPPVFVCLFCSTPPEARGTRNRTSSGAVY